jgi:hypothetical protein
MSDSLSSNSCGLWISGLKAIVFKFVVGHGASRGTPPDVGLDMRW